MPKTIYVTTSQIMAARALIRLAERGIGEAGPAIHAIANAKRRWEPDDDPAPLPGDLDGPGSASRD